MIDHATATRIAEQHVGQLSDGSPDLTLFAEGTVERDFGWVFFYGSRHSSEAIAGNPPFIVDRLDGSAHETGTAYPLEEYLQSYARVRRAYPFAVPEHTVILTGWTVGIPKVSLTKAIRRATGKSLASAKRCTDDVLARKPVVLAFASEEQAAHFQADIERLGAAVERRVSFR